MLKVIKRKTRRTAELGDDLIAELRRLRQRAEVAIVEAREIRARFETSAQAFRATAQRTKQE